MVPITMGACQDIALPSGCWMGGPMGCSVWTANWLGSLEEAFKNSAKYPWGCRVPVPILLHWTHLWKCMAIFSLEKMEQKP